jgi:hypothetical protein
MGKTATLSRFQHALPVGMSQQDVKKYLDFALSVAGTL